MEFYTSLMEKINNDHPNDLIDFFGGSRTWRVSKKNCFFPFLLPNKNEVPKLLFSSFFKQMICEECNETNIQTSRFFVEDIWVDGKKCISEALKGNTELEFPCQNCCSKVSF